MTPAELESIACLRRARDAIDRDYATPLDVPTMARLALMSPAHFSRRFRAAYGETPYSYLMTRRIEGAMALAPGRNKRDRRMHGGRLHLSRVIQLEVLGGRRVGPHRVSGP